MFGFPAPILLALLINEFKNKHFVKTVQTATYLPHFISLVVMCGIFKTFCGANGIITQFVEKLTGDGTSILLKPEMFTGIYVGTNIWQEIGWDTIIYMAALGSVSQELHEAAMIDGASKWKRIFNIDLPTILPTAGIMMIMRFGHVMSVGFEKVYLMQNPLNIDVSEVISTYVYKVGMGSVKDFSYGAAVGLFNSVVNCFMLILVNWITKKISDREVSLF